MSITTLKKVPGLTSGRKHLDSLLDVSALQPILERVMKEKELQLLAMRESQVLEIIVVRHLSEQRGSSYNVPNPLNLSCGYIESSFRARDCFIFLCHLTLFQTQGHNLIMVELFNELLQKGYASVKDLM